MEVIQHQQQMLLSRGVLEKSRDRVEQTEAGLVGLLGPGGGEFAQDLGDLRQQTGNYGGAAAHLIPKTFGACPADVGPDRVHPGPIRRSALPFVTPTPQYLGALGPGVAGQVLSRAGFADARLSHQHHNLAAPVFRLGQRGPE